MFAWPWLVIALSAHPSPSEFEFRDVESVETRPVNRHRALELSDRPVRPIAWETAAPAGIQHGLVPVGPHVDSALAFAWDPAHSILWLDADGDRRFTRSERFELGSKNPLEVPATIALRAGSSGKAHRLRRTLLFRPGLLGSGLRYTVRGAVLGAVDLGGRATPAMLTDGNADGGFDAAGVDRVWLDLDRDARFDPVSEQFLLGVPVVVGANTFTVSSDFMARTVAAHERDPRVGTIRLALGEARRGPSLVALSATLVSETGDLLVIEKLDEPKEAHVGRYRVSAIAIELADESGRLWSYSFRGGREATIRVGPDAESRADLLHGLAMEVTVDAPGEVRPDDEVNVTPHLRFPSGLYLANCVTRRGPSGRDEERGAEIVLRSPSNAPLNRVVSGFA